MSWEDIMRRVLPPTGGVSAHITSAYGATNRPKGSSNPHRGVDFNYSGGRDAPLNLSHQALHSPADGIVENAGSGTAGRIAIRDKNGFLHEILHTHTRHVSVGDPVVAGQLIGTMGNTGVRRPNVEDGASGATATPARNAPRIEILSGCASALKNSALKLLSCCLMLTVL